MFVFASHGEGDVGWPLFAVRHQEKHVHSVVELQVIGTPAPCIHFFSGHIKKRQILDHAVAFTCRKQILKNMTDILTPNPGFLWKSGEESECNKTKY